ncbi:hypothetical protein Tco_0045947 [Tanacetum coccineum]
MTPKVCKNEKQWMLRPPRSLVKKDVNRWLDEVAIQTWIRIDPVKIQMMLDVSRTKSLSQVYLKLRINPAISRDDLTELYRIVMNRYGMDGPEDKLEKVCLSGGDIFDDPSLLRYYQNDKYPPWGNRRRRRMECEEGPDWMSQNSFEDKLANFMLENDLQLKGLEKCAMNNTMKCTTNFLNFLRAL